MVSVVDDVTPPIRNCYYLRKNHDDRNPDKYLRAKRGLSMAEANPSGGSTHAPSQDGYEHLFPPIFHFLFPSNNKFVYVF
jgi:hypothetical protein